MRHPGDGVQKAGVPGWTSVKRGDQNALRTLFFMVIKNQNYMRRQIQQRNERQYHTLMLFLKYFLIEGKVIFEDFILSNPDTYLYNRQLEAMAKELKDL